MKIIKTSDECKLAKRRKQMANVGCSVCPCCGEDKKSNYYLRQDIFDKGIISYPKYTRIKGFIKIKEYRKDWYKCTTCGAEWESEEYEYEY